LRNIPTELLRGFAALTETGGFGKAARLIGRSQPAVSLQIKRLEDLVGQALIDRKAKGLKLTEAGETLALYARQILCLNDEAMARLSEDSLAGRIRIGLPNDFAVSFLADILSDFASTHERALLEVDCRISGELLDGLFAESHDIVIALCEAKAQRLLIKSWRENLCWIGPASGKVGQSNPLPLAVYPEGCIYRRSILAALKGAGRDWRIAFVSASLEGLTAALRAGLGVTVLSEKTVPPGFRRLADLPDLPAVELGLYCRRDRLSKAGLALINHIVRRLDDAHAADKA
jgi:DNA-binding transcriptional LysR family regulator